MIAAGADATLARVLDMMGRSGARVDPPTLMPAETILELSGEAIRSRLCTFTDAAGRELCLRPDLTTPIADLVARGRLPVARYYSSGPVYRLPPRGSDEPIEHLQVGFEWFGAGGSPEEDAEALSVAFEAAKAGGLGTADVRAGDVAIYHAVIAALPFSDQWRGRLRRAFSRRKGPRELLEAATRGETGIPALAPSVAAMTVPDAIAAVEAMMVGLGVAPVGGRGPEEIVERLRDKAADTAPDARTSSALLRYLDLSAPANAAVAVLRAFARDLGLNLDSAIDAYARRLDRIAALKPPFWSAAVFSAEAGRRFEYYDGFVFELSRQGAAERPIVSGGRYDGLVARLSNRARSASAIGAALRIDRLAEAA